MGEAGVLVRTRVDFVTGDVPVLRHEFAGVEWIAVHVGIPVITEEIGGVHGGEAFQNGRRRTRIATLAFHAIEDSQIARNRRHAMDFLLPDGAGVRGMDPAPRPDECIAACGEFRIVLFFRTDVIGEGLAGTGQFETSLFGMGPSVMVAPQWKQTSFSGSRSIHRML